MLSRSGRMTCLGVRRGVGKCRWALPLSVLASLHLSTLVINHLIRLEKLPDDFLEAYALGKTGLHRATFLLLHPHRTYPMLFTLKGDSAWIAWGYYALATRLVVACFHALFLPKYIDGFKQLDGILTLPQRMLATLHLTAQSFLQPTRQPSPTGVWYLSNIAIWNLIGSIAFPAGLVAEALYAVTSLLSMTILCVRYTQFSHSTARLMPGIMLWEAVVVTALLAKEFMLRRRGRAFGGVLAPGGSAAAGAAASAARTWGAASGLTPGSGKHLRDLGQPFCKQLHFQQETQAHADVGRGSQHPVDCGSDCPIPEREQDGWGSAAEDSSKGSPNARHGPAATPASWGGPAVHGTHKLPGPFSLTAGRSAHDAVPGSGDGGKCRSDGYGPDNLEGVPPAAASTEAPRVPIQDPAPAAAVAVFGELPTLPQASSAAASTPSVLAAACAGGEAGAEEGESPSTFDTGRPPARGTGYVRWQETTVPDASATDQDTAAGGYSECSQLMPLPLGPAVAPVVLLRPRNGTFGVAAVAVRPRTAASARAPPSAVATAAVVTAAGQEAGRVRRRRVGAAEAPASHTTGPDASSNRPLRPDVPWPGPTGSRVPTPGLAAPMPEPGTASPAVAFQPSPAVPHPIGPTPVPRYVSRTLLGTTRVKIRGPGAHPELIAPGYEQRIAAVLAAAGQQLEGVYVRSGCIEIVIDARRLSPQLPVCETRDRRGRSDSAESLSLVGSSREGSRSPCGRGGGCGDGGGQAARDISGDGAGGFGDICMTQTLPAADAEADGEAGEAGRCGYGSDGEPHGDGDVDIGAIIRALQLPHEVSYMDNEHEVDDEEVEPAAGESSGCWGGADGDHPLIGVEEEALGMDLCRAGGWYHAAGAVPGHPYVVSVQSLVVLPPADTPPRPCPEDDANGAPSTCGADGGGSGRSDDKAPAASLELTVLVRAPDRQPLELSARSRGRYLPLSRPCVVSRTPLAATTAAAGAAATGTCGGGFLTVVRFTVLEVPPTPAMLLVGAHRAEDGTGVQPGRLACAPVLLLDDTELAAEIQNGLAACLQQQRQQQPHPGPPHAAEVASGHDEAMGAFRDLLTDWGSFLHHAATLGREPLPPPALLAAAAAPAPELPRMGSCCAGHTVPAGLRSPAGSAGSGPAGADGPDSAGDVASGPSSLCAADPALNAGDCADAGLRRELTSLGLHLLQWFHASGGNAVWPATIARLVSELRNVQQLTAAASVVHGGEPVQAAGQPVAPTAAAPAAADSMAEEDEDGAFIDEEEDEVDVRGGLALLGCVSESSGGVGAGSGSGGVGVCDAAAAEPQDAGLVAQVHTAVCTLRERGGSRAEPAWGSQEGCAEDDWKVVEGYLAAQDPGPPHGGWQQKGAGAAAAPAPTGPNGRRPAAPHSPAAPGAPAPVAVLPDPCACHPQRPAPATRSARRSQEPGAGDARDDAGTATDKQLPWQAPASVALCMQVRRPAGDEATASAGPAGMGPLSEEPAGPAGQLGCPLQQHDHQQQVDPGQETPPGSGSWAADDAQVEAWEWSGAAGSCASSAVGPPRGRSDDAGRVGFDRDGLPQEGGAARRLRGLVTRWPSPGRLWAVFLAFLRELGSRQHHRALEQYVLGIAAVSDLLTFLSVSLIVLRAWQEPVWRQRPLSAFVSHVAGIVLTTSVNFISSVSCMVLPQPTWARLVPALQPFRLAAYIVVNALVGFYGWDVPSSVPAYHCSWAAWPSEGVAFGGFLGVMPWTAVVLAALRAHTHVALWRSICPSGTFSSRELVWRAYGIAAAFVLSNLALHAYLLASQHRTRAARRREQHAQHAARDCGDGDADPATCTAGQGASHRYCDPHAEEVAATVASGEGSVGSTSGASATEVTKRRVGKGQ